MINENQLTVVIHGRMKRVNVVSGQADAVNWEGGPLHIRWSRYWGYSVRHTTHSTYWESRVDAVPVNPSEKRTADRGKNSNDGAVKIKDDEYNPLVLELGLNISLKRSSDGLGRELVNTFSIRTHAIQVLGPPALGRSNLCVCSEWNDQPKYGPTFCFQLHGRVPRHWVHTWCDAHADWTILGAVPSHVGERAANRLRVILPLLHSRTCHLFNFSLDKLSLAVVLNPPIIYSPVFLSFPFFLSLTSYRLPTVTHAFSEASYS